MPRKQHASQQRDTLRRKAEQLARATRAEIQHMSMEEIQQLVHELQVHQIELDLQNEELRRTQLALEETRDNYQDLFEWAPIGYAVLDPRGTIVQANARVAHLLAVERTYLHRRRLREFIASEDQHRFERFWQDVLSAEESRTCELHLLPSCPSQRVRLKSEISRKQEKEERRYLVAIVDLTAEKALQQSLESQQARLNGIVESAMDAIVTVDEDQRIVLFNTAAERMFQSPATEAIGQPIDRFIPERFRDMHHEHMRRFAKSQTTTKQMGRLGLVWGRRADGDEIPLESSISQVEVEGKKLLTVIHRDVTDRVHMQKILQEERDFVSAVLNTAGALVVVLDPEGRIVRFNRACEGTIGYTADEVMGRPFWDVLLTPQGVEPFKAALEQLRTTKAPYTHENYWQTKHGGLRWIVWSSTVLIGERGDIDYFIATGLDQTEKRQTDQALREREQMLQHTQDRLRALANRLTTVAENERSRIARDLHDDASQRLAAILFDLSILQKAPDLSELHRESLQVIQERISSLSDDIHRLSYALHPKVLDDLGLVAAIRALIAGFTHDQRPHISLRTREVPQHIASHTGLCCYRVIQLALDNVIKHARAAHVQVTITSLPNGLGVCIADDGKGFNPDQITSRPSLGLLSMKERALALSGHIRVRSSRNRGTHVHLRLPFPDKRPSQEDTASG